MGIVLFLLPIMSCSDTEEPIEYNVPGTRGEPPYTPLTLNNYGDTISGDEHTMLLKLKLVPGRLNRKVDERKLYMWYIYAQMSYYFAEYDYYPYYTPVQADKEHNGVDVFSTETNAEAGDSLTFNDSWVRICEDHKSIELKLEANRSGKMRRITIGGCVYPHDLELENFIYQKSL